MPFKKGQSGNINGRIKGSQNKMTKQLRETIILFLERNYVRLENDFDSLPPRDRIKFYCDLLQYGLPKLQSVQLESDFDSLSDTQLDKIITELKENTDE
jgi:hypothetical protein